MTSYKNYIGGEFVAASAGEFTNYNPADTREAVATYANAGEADANAAVAAAGGGVSRMDSTDPHRPRADFVQSLAVDRNQESGAFETAHARGGKNAG